MYGKSRIPTLLDDVGQNLVVLGPFFDRARLWNFVWYGCVEEGFWLWFLFGFCIFLSFVRFRLVFVIDRLVFRWSNFFWIFDFSRFLKIEVVFVSLFLAVCFVILLLSTVPWRGSELGGVCDLCGRVCLFLLAGWVRLGGWARHVRHWRWRVCRLVGTSLGGAGLCVRGKRSLSLYICSRSRKPFLVSWLLCRFVLGVCNGLVFSFSFVLSLCSSFTFRIRRWFFLCGKDSHVVQCSRVSGDGLTQNSWLYWLKISK
jgi:hypothetical protein